MELKDLGAIGYKAHQGPEALLVLAHGAGAGQQHPFMTEVAKGFATRGVDVVTFDFPYMRERRKIPDKAPILEKSFLDVLAGARSWSAAPTVFIGGKSMGGRMATHLGAAHVDGLNGIVVFGYPLHPPGKPDQLRVAHLPSINVPVLIIQGERDAFGTPQQLKPAIDSMSTRVDLHTVERGYHSLAERDDVLSEVIDVAVAWMQTAADTTFKTADRQRR
jgi:predicted alpha/beta-hydrolase family hydrolase